MRITVATCVPMNTTTWPATLQDDGSRQPVRAADQKVRNQRDRERKTGKR